MELLVLLTLLIIGFFLGRHNEKKHYQSIESREKKYISLPTTNLKKPIQGEVYSRVELVQGSVVISIDHFKRLLATFRSLVGGNVSSYETLIDRARREAILRMKESSNGADIIYNLRVETSSISKNARKGSVGSVEVLAYGTALHK